MILQVSSTARSIRRPGLTLLEVIISLAIFLFSIVAIGHLVNVATDRALQAQLRQQAGFLCQSKLAEIAAGAEPLSSQTDAAFAEDAEWHWSSECSQGDIVGVWKVTVNVNRQLANGGMLAVSLSQYVFDPAMRGSTADPAPTTTVEEETGSSSSSSQGSSSNSNSGSSGGSTSKGGGSSAPPPSSQGSGPMGNSGKGGKQ